MARYNASNDYAGHEMYIKQRPPMIPAKTTTPQLPTPIDFGVYQVYSLPIGTGSDNEWVKWIDTVPRRWDGASDAIFSVVCILNTANTNKNFKIRTEWEHFSPTTEIFPSTSNIVEIQQATGTAAQYKAYRLNFTIDYDIDGVGYEIKAGDSLGFKVYRIAASANEITGEVMIGGATITYKHDKIGLATAY